MSDSFAELWALSSPTKSTQQQPQQKLGSVLQPRRPQYDTFSILSASQPLGRPVVHNQPNDRRSKQAQVTPRGEDAFSDLFVSSLDGTAAGGIHRANMTIAEQAALTQQAKAVQKGDAFAQIAQASTSPTLWDGLDTLARLGAAPPSQDPPTTPSHEPLATPLWKEGKKSIVIKDDNGDSNNGQRTRDHSTTTILLSTLSSSTSHKSAGTDAYKRGDFPVALAAYIRALSALPHQHILRVPILTNVALVRSKLGELRDTIKACEEAVVIVRQFVGGADGMDDMSFAGTEPGFDEKAPVEVGSGKVSVLIKGGGARTNGDLPTTIDLAEGLSKAFRRRAEALEGLEKWDAARSTWEVLLGAEWADAGVKMEAVKGASRCRKIIDGDRAGQSGPPMSKPNASRPTPKPSVSSPPSAALTALRSAHNAQQTEDAARLEFKDAVETRLTAWKSGKEGNIRALLTSLDDTILWPELGWRKVGMAEVVSKGQVKGAYMRAIARVHPDKLNVGNTTVEQRLLASGVFGTLNEAWNVFQQQ